MRSENWNLSGSVSQTLDRRKRNWSEPNLRSFFRELILPPLSPSILQPQVTLQRLCYTELYSSCIQRGAFPLGTPSQEEGRWRHRFEL